MSQYFRPRRATTSSATSDIHIPCFFPSTDGPRNDVDGSDADLAVDESNRVTSSAILIFPNPPTEQGTSRSATGSGYEFSGSSTLSLPTDLSLESVRSTSRSRSRGERERPRNRDESWQSMLRSHTLPRDGGGWDEMLPEEQQSEWELDSSGYLRVEHTKFINHSPRGGPHTRTSSSGLSSPFSLPFSLSPQPPLRLPFLSFFQSVLTLDESTLHLISRSPDPHGSSLFPVSPGPNSYSHALDDDKNNDDTEDGDDEFPHGALRLLLNNPDKPQNTALHKAAIDPSEILGEFNPFLVSPTQIPVWRLLGFVIEGGVRVWKEVRAWHAGDLMGV